MSCHQFIKVKIPMTNRNAQIAELKAAIKTLEVQRPILGNLAVDSALEGLHLRLKELEEKSSVPSQVDGERRQATILFSDLSGYTAMSEYLDPEEVEEIMNRIKEAAIRIIEGYEGTVNQFIGDEVVSLFGIPNAHEDDPSRAVKAALELHLMVRQMSGDLKSRINHALTMHSGINTGLIVTTSRDDRDGKFGLTGDTV
ncbi:MAG: class 3 adenylate cyclase, partial [Parasphingorhabdus sp.]